MKKKNLNIKLIIVVSILFFNYYSSIAQGCVANFTIENLSTNTYKFTVDSPPSNAVAYFWDFGDATPTSYHFSPTHVYVDDSCYNVCLTIYTVGGDSCYVCKNICDSIPTSLSNIDNSENNFNIYPNPANDYWNLNFQSAIQNKLQIQVVDILGKVVYQKAYKSTIGKNLIIIPNTNFSSGIYLLRIVGKENSIIYKVEKL